MTFLSVMYPWNIGTLYETLIKRFTHTQVKNLIESYLFLVGFRPITLWLECIISHDMMLQGTLRICSLFLHLTKNENVILLFKILATAFLACQKYAKINTFKCFAVNSHKLVLMLQHMLSKFILPELSILKSYSNSSESLIIEYNCQQNIQIIMPKIKIN